MKQEKDLFAKLKAERDSILQYGDPKVNNKILIEQFAPAPIALSNKSKILSGMGSAKEAQADASGLFELSEALDSAHTPMMGSHNMGKLVEEQERLRLK